MILVEYPLFEARNAAVLVNPFFDSLKVLEPTQADTAKKTKKD